MCVIEQIFKRWFICLLLCSSSKKINKRALKFSLTQWFYAKRVSLTQLWHILYTFLLRDKNDNIHINLLIKLWYCTYMSSNVYFTYLMTIKFYLILGSKRYVLDFQCYTIWIWDSSFDSVWMHRVCDSLKCWVYLNQKTNIKIFRWIKIHTNKNR